MAEIQVAYDLLVKGLVQRLQLFYPADTFHIYDNRVVGDMLTPCFVIHAVQIQANKLRTNRYQYIYSMDVRYYSDKDKNLLESDMNQKAVEMLEVLDEVFIEDVKLKVENDRVYCEKEEDVLHCFANYIHEASPILKEDPSMNNLDMSAATKEEI